MPTHLNHTPRIVNKPWGSETWWSLDRHFCTKTIKINPATRTSYQYHVEKEEINFIRAGEAEVWLEDDTGTVHTYHLRAGDSFFVPAGRKHRVIALTQLEMFEVSTPQVDDVVRLADEFGRKDGRIESEHARPAVLILAAGMGSRLGKLTAKKNKALLPIAGKAIISHILDKFPADYDVVVALGHEKDSLREYLTLAHPERNFVFVEVDRWEDPKTNPGYSAYCCRAHLQRPFYLVANDCLIDGPIPHIEGNWIGVAPTSFPEKYATVNVIDGQVVGVADKVRAETGAGYENAFVGIAAILDFSTYFRELERSQFSVIDVWARTDEYPTLRAKELKWLDTGNLDDLRAARERFEGIALASPKDLDEITYRVNDRILKYHLNPQVSRNRYESWKRLSQLDLAPEGMVGGNQFISYRWIPGKNLYECDSLEVYTNYLKTLQDLIEQTRTPIAVDYSKFYRDKTIERLHLLSVKYPRLSLHAEYVINDRPCRSLSRLLELADVTIPGIPYAGFHGDLHWDNIIFDGARQRFVYVDWRESFAGSTTGGDMYYDLAKLYCGCLVPMELLKDDESVTLSEGDTTVSYAYPTTQSLAAITDRYEHMLESWATDPKWPKVLAGLSFLNIAPLHTERWGRVLFYKAIQTLDDAL